MEPYLGEIRMFAGSYAPNGWALCNGAALQVSQYQALYSLLGTAYGGNGTSDFKIPDLRSRVPVHIGNGPSGIQGVIQGQALGTEKVTLEANNLPAHTHTVNAVNAIGSASSPAGLLPSASNTSGRFVYAPSNSPTSVQMNADSIVPTPAANPVPIVQPYITINFIISTTGIYPTPN